MLLSEKVTLAMILFTIIFLVISWNSGLEVFVVLTLIGVLILREMIEMFAPSELKVRMNLLLYIGVIIFMVLILERVINVIIETLIK